MNKTKNKKKIKKTKNYSKKGGSSNKMQQQINNLFAELRNEMRVKRNEMGENRNGIKGSRKAIFLDVDGVLHPSIFPGFAAAVPKDEYLQDRPVELIKNLAESTNSDIVISSSWRFHEEFMQELTEKFEIPLLMVDPNYNNNSGEREGLRAQHIYDYIVENGITNYIIIDDMSQTTMFGRHITATLQPLVEHFLQTNNEIGFTSDDYVKAKKILDNQFGLGKSRQQKKDKKWNKGNKGKTIYSSKHTRRYEALLEKSKEQPKVKNKGEKSKRDGN